jgi:uncharacterized protein YjaG (DUF416 family)
MSNKLSTFARVRALEGWKAVAFSAALLMRMTPNYRLFCQLTEFADGEILTKCQGLIWESLRSPKSRINFALQLEKIEEATPDISDFDAYGVYPAVDACMAMVASLQLLLKQDLEGAVVVSKLSQGSVEAYLLLSGEATDENVKHHPLMEFEIAIQQEILSVLETTNDLMRATDIIKEIALSEGISNIGLDLHGE